MPTLLGKAHEGGDHLSGDANGQLRRRMQARFGVDLLHLHPNHEHPVGPPAQRPRQFEALGKGEGVARCGHAGRQRLFGDVENDDAARRRPRHHGVDNEQRSKSRQQVDEPSGLLHLGHVDAHLAESSGHSRPGPVVAPEGVSDRHHGEHEREATRTDVRAQPVSPSHRHAQRPTQTQAPDSNRLLVMPSGPTLFARFAFPPNELGLCGPDDGALLAAVAEGADDGGIHQVLQAFTGAYPYLRLIADQAGSADPLDAAIVEAYWLGHGSAANVELLDLGNHLRERFRPRLGNGWMAFSDSLDSAPHPTHAFHVFGVYPWLGKLRDGMVEPSLRILDRCRVRWGAVEAVTGLQAEVRSSPLGLVGQRLALADPVKETVNLYAGLGVAVGDTLALHWDWACAVLDDPQLGSLQADTRRALDAIGPIDPAR